MESTLFYSKWKIYVDKRIENNKLSEGGVLGAYQNNKMWYDFQSDNSPTETKWRRSW